MVPERESSHFCFIRRSTLCFLSVQVCCRNAQL